MKEKILKYLMIITSIILLFYYFSHLDYNSKKKDADELIIITTKTTTSEVKEKEDITTSEQFTTIITPKITTKINQNNNQELENYIKSVVACEMPALYNKEALKAQAVAARTYALYQKNIGNGAITKEDQCYLSDSEMIAKWGNNKDKYYKLISDAVDETTSEIMKKNGQLFKSYYFSTSNGYTEDSITVFGDGDLLSVESVWDKTSSNYETTIDFTKESIIDKLGLFENIIITKRNSTNHVEQVMVDNKEISGIEFRKLLGLRSTDFDIKENNNLYSITTYGYGHGVGMSQYGANELAKQGKSYAEILKYYYGNIEITTS